MKTRCILILLVMLIILPMFYSCEVYEKASENGPFSVSVDVVESGVDGVVFTVYLLDGVVEGYNTLSVLITDVEKNHPNFVLNDEDGNRVQENNIWSFSSDGKATFVIHGLVPKDYDVLVKVSRYYHSALCGFKIEF